MQHDDFSDCIALFFKGDIVIKQREINIPKHLLDIEAKNRVFVDMREKMEIWKPKPERQVK